MDRRVKERLIGASILVALVVLIVPELLSGPKPAPTPTPTLPAAAPEPNRTVTLDLSTSKSPANPDDEQPAQPASTAANTSAQSATSAGSAAAAGTPATTAAPLPQAPSSASAVHPPSVETAAPAPISSLKGAWSVQLGSFARRDNADNLTRQMKGQGFSAFVLEGGSGSAVRYRVRVGPLQDRESAARVAAKLKSLGHVSSLVAPAG